MESKQRLIDATELAEKIYTSTMYVVGRRNGKTLIIEWLEWYRNEILRMICKATTVDAVPVVHGRWERIVGMMPPEYHGRHTCSCCGVRALDRKFHEELSNYCPNYGAKMDGDN